MMTTTTAQACPPWQADLTKPYPSTPTPAVFAAPEDNL
jgi:hypothetical protein